MVVHSLALPKLWRPSAFSALSVEPYGGSMIVEGGSTFTIDFQCSLCRAVWWFVAVDAYYPALPALSVLSL